MVIQTVKTALNLNAAWLNTSKRIPQYPVDFDALTKLVRALSLIDPEAKAFIPISTYGSRIPEDGDFISWSCKGPSGSGWVDGATADVAIKALENQHYKGINQVTGIGLVPNRLGLMALDVDGPAACDFLQKHGLWDEVVNAVNTGTAWTSGGSSRFTVLVQVPSEILEVTRKIKPNLEFAPTTKSPKTGKPGGWKLDARFGDADTDEKQRERNPKKLITTIQVVLGGSRHHWGDEAKKTEWGYRIINDKRPQELSQGWWNKLLALRDCDKKATTKPRREGGQKDAAVRVDVVKQLCEVKGLPYDDSNPDVINLSPLCHDSQSGKSAFQWINTGLIECKCCGTELGTDAYAEAAKELGLFMPEYGKKGRKKGSQSGNKTDEGGGVMGLTEFERHQWVLDWMEQRYYFDLGSKQWWRCDGGFIWGTVDQYEIERDLAIDHPEMTTGRNKKVLATCVRDAVTWAKIWLCQEKPVAPFLIPFFNVAVNAKTLERVELSNDQHWENVTSKTDKDGNAVSIIPKIALPDGDYQSPSEWLFMAMVSMNGDVMAVLLQLALIRAVSLNIDFTKIKGGKAVMLDGPTGTGKSIFLNMLKRAAGVRARDGVMAHFAPGDRFSRGNWKGSSVIVVAEGEPCQDAATGIKCAVTGDGLTYEYKGVQGLHTYVNRALIAISTNDKIIYKDAGGAVARRFIKVPVLQMIHGDDFTEESINLALNEQFPGLLRLADSIWHSEDELREFIGTAQETVPSVAKLRFAEINTESIVEFLETQCLIEDGDDEKSHCTYRQFLNHWIAWATEVGHVSSPIKRMDEFIKRIELEMERVFGERIHFDDVNKLIPGLFLPGANKKEPTFTDVRLHGGTRSSFRTLKPTPMEGSKETEAVERLAEAIAGDPWAVDIYKRLNRCSTLRNPNTHYFKTDWEWIEDVLCGDNGDDE